MIYRLVLIVGILGMLLSSCERESLAEMKANGVDVTRVQIMKSQRKMQLLAGNTIIREYDIDLGRVPVGDKRIEGDGKTPEGVYVIDRLNPKSRFYRSIGISYPNAKDRAEARALGKSPGGDIFIHGQPNFFMAPGPDWTEGCIAVTNADMNEIFQFVPVGTQIIIYP